MTHTTTHIVFPIFDRMTQLDFTGPHQVFSGVPDARITIASVDGRDVEAAGGPTFTNLTNLSEVESCDVLCVPGGSGTSAAITNEAYMREIRRLAGGAKYLTSVCTGSFVLGAAGLLKGKRATTHWARRELLPSFGVVVEHERVVRDGNVITGGGVTAGIDFALTVVSEVFGRDTAEALQLRYEYSPAPPFETGRPEDAPKELVASVRQGLSKSEASLRAAIDKVLAAKVSRVG
ncbi:MAG TPA: DJ-1/PfpI family protein [Rhizobiaceae bacterium]|nr:DJ-1/PfpI family protein [Rhizobiaceae bacterium]